LADTPPLLVIATSGLCLTVPCGDPNCDGKTT